LDYFSRQFFIIFMSSPGASIKRENSSKLNTFASINFEVILGRISKMYIVQKH